MFGSTSLVREEGVDADLTRLRHKPNDDSTLVSESFWKKSTILE
jgi:hypothetical protein